MSLLWWCGTCGALSDHDGPAQPVRCSGYHNGGACPARYWVQEGRVVKIPIDTNTDDDRVVEALLARRSAEKSSKKEEASPAATDDAPVLDTCTCGKCFK